MTGDADARRRERLVVGGWLVAALAVTAGLAVLLLATTTAVRRPIAWATAPLASAAGVEVDLARLVRAGGAALLVAGGLRRTDLDRNRTPAIGAVLALAGGLALVSASVATPGVALAVAGALGAVGLGVARLARSTGLDPGGRRLVGAGCLALAVGFSTATEPGTSAPYVEPWTKWAMAGIGLALVGGGVSIGRRAARLAGW